MVKHSRLYYNHACVKAGKKGDEIVDHSPDCQSQSRVVFFIVIAVTLKAIRAGSQHKRDEEAWNKAVEKQRSRMTI